MLLVPLLVAIAVLTVAVMSRVEARERHTALGEGAGAESCRPGGKQHPLREAFPQLQIWIPSDELLGRGPTAEGRMSARAMPGAIGPDIIIGPWTQAARRRDDAHTDAA